MENLVIQLTPKAFHVAVGEMAYKCKIKTANELKCEAHLKDRVPP